MTCIAFLIGCVVGAVGTLLPLAYVALRMGFAPVPERER